MGWCIIIAIFFFSLKIGVLFNFFHTNNLLFTVNENAYRKSYPYSPYYALSTTSRKVRMQHSHFAISTNFLAKEQSVKAKLKDGTPHCLLTIDISRHSFGWNTWRNPNLVSFNVFEEKPRVTKFFRNGFCSFRCSKSVKIWIRSALFLSESSWGTQSANFHTFLSFVVEWSTLKSSANILFVKLSSSSTAAKSAWSSKFDS